MARLRLVLILALGLLAAYSTLPPPATELSRRAPPGESEVGFASYYGAESQGSPTANGERFDDRKLTAAHRTLPFGTLVRVENLRNGVSVVVRINDRGPYVRGRIIDLSRAAAERLGMLIVGVARVRVTVVRRP